MHGMGKAGDTTQRSSYDVSWRCANRVLTWVCRRPIIKRSAGGALRMAPNRLS